MNNKLGFTLAEVLITLGIIGVVAALTMPVLISNHQKQVTVTRLKEAYSIVSQAVLLAQRDHGSPSTWSTHSGEIWLDKQQVSTEFCEQYVIPYIKSPQIHGWKSVKDIGIQNGYVALNKKPIENGNLTKNVYNYVIELNNGQILYFNYNNDNKGTLGQALVYTDINGKKGPNMFGRDAFLFAYDLSKGRLMPFMYSYSADIEKRCVKDAEWDSILCANKIIKDGWQIKDDYPW